MAYHRMMTVTNVWRWILRIVAGVAALSIVAISPPFGVPLYASESSERPIQVDVHIGILENFFSGLNVMDAEAAVTVFGKTLGTFHGYNTAVTVHRFKDPHDIISGPLSGKIDILILDSWSYLEIEQAVWLEPALLSSEGGQVSTRYLLLTRSGTDLNGIGDLRGKSLNLFNSPNAKIGSPWLKKMLMENHLGEPAEFFDRIVFLSDPMTTILQVFFGNRDAALIDETRYELMIELNPQLKQLKIIEISEPFVGYVVCYKRTGWSPPEFKEKMYRVAQDLHLDPKAKQIFTLFKMDRLVKYEPGQLDSLRRLRHKIMTMSLQDDNLQGRLDGYER